MLELIAEASRWIHFENYIIRSDTVGRRFADALIARARAGVRVRVLYDAIGSLCTSRALLARPPARRRRGPRLSPDPPAQPGHQLLPQPPQAGRGRRVPRGHRRPLHRLRVDRRRPSRRSALARHGGADRGPAPPRCSTRRSPGPGESPAGARAGRQRGRPGDPRGRRRGPGDRRRARTGAHLPGDRAAHRGQHRAALDHRCLSRRAASTAAGAS